MIKITAKNIVRKESIEDFKAAARELVEKSAAEDGNISYTLNQSIEDPCVFCFIEQWRDQAAIDAHNASEHFTRLVPILGSFQDNPLPAELYTEVEY